MGIGGAETARLIASLELQDKNFTRGLKQAEKRLGRIDKKLGAFSGAVNRNVARGIDTLITKGIDAGQAVIQAAVDQESAITGIAKTVNGNIDAIVGDLKRLSTETGSTFEELAGIAELGGAMGIAKDDLTAFTEQVAILGATTDVSVEDAATALGQLQNVIGLSGDEFDNFTASLVDLGNKGASTESQILEIAKRSGAAAKLIGVAKEETLGWASAAANLGLNQELAGTALQNLFLKGATAQAGLAQVAGVNVKKFKKLWAKDATGALQLFLKELGKLDQEKQIKAIQEIFGKGSGLTRLILGLAGDQDNLTKSLNDGTAAWEAGTAAQAEADKRFATSEFAFKRLNNSVNLAAATIGTELLPVLVELAEEGIAWLMEPKTQKAIKAFAVDLGKGLRSAVKVLKGIDWSGLAGALGTVAGIGKEVVKAFMGLPAWAQAVLIGGFAANKITGGALGSIVTDIFKAKLGITAGTVFLTGKSVVGGGGAPIPSGGGGPLPATLAGRITGALKTLLRGTLTVAVVGAALVLWQKVADDFGKLQTWLVTQQGKLDELIEGTSEQNFQQTLDNLNSTVKGWNTNLNLFQQLISPITSGGQFTKDFEMAADRIRKEFEAGNLDRSQMVAALEALKGAQTLMPEFIETPKLDSLVADLTTALKNPPAPGGGPKEPVRPGDNLFQQLIALEAEQAATKDAIRPIPAALRAAEAEIGKVKGSVATMDQNARANAIAAIAATTAGNLLSVFQSAAQVLAQGSTTTAVNGTTTAARNAGLTTAGAMTTAANRIVTAVNGLDLSVNVTTVNRTSTVNNRYGPTSGSSTGNRTYSGQ